MSDLDDFLTAIEAIADSKPCTPEERDVLKAGMMRHLKEGPQPMIARSFTARLQKLTETLATLPEETERTYACGRCLDAAWLRREKRNGQVALWPCANCAPGRSVIAYHWLDLCFPYEPRFGKRIASARGQREFDEYLKYYPEQELWLKTRIDQMRNEDQATRNRLKENPWNRQ